MKRLFLVIAVATLVGVPAQASGSVTIGQSPPSRGTGNVCFDGREFLQSSVGAGVIYATQTSGVITSWRTFLSSADAGVELSMRTYRPAGGNVFTPQTESAVATLGSTPGVEQVMLTRQSVAAGDVLGLHAIDDHGSNSICIYTATGLAGDVEGTLSPAASLGTPNAYVTAPSVLVDVAAVVEADVDQDGYGDETQDGCPSDATTHDTCPVVKDVDPPETTIDKAPPKKLKGTKAKVVFSSDEPGSTFTCRLDKAAAKSCTSPWKLSHLKPGKHKVSVAATDAAGNTDPTSAVSKFKVKRKRRAS